MTAAPNATPKLIPQRPWAPATREIQQQQPPPVRFSVNGSGCINLSDAIAGNTNGLEHGQDPAFSDMSQKKSFRLEWPVPPVGSGYASYSRQITVRDSTKDANPITVAKLAKKVAEEMKRFIERNAEIECRDATWKVGEGYITLDRLLLVEVRQVSEGSIQPVLMVL